MRTTLLAVAALALLLGLAPRCALATDGATISAPAAGTLLKKPPFGSGTVNTWNYDTTHNQYGIMGTVHDDPPDDYARTPLTIQMQPTRPVNPAFDHNWNYSDASDQNYRDPSRYLTRRFCEELQ